MKDWLTMTNPITNKNELEISKINADVSESFRKSILMQSLVDKKFATQGKIELSKLRKTNESVYQKEIGSFVKVNRIKFFLELNSANPSSEKIFDINESSLKVFLTNFENEVKSEIEPIFQKQIESLKRGYSAVIKAKENEYKSEKLIYLTKVEKSESELFAAHQELEKKDSENTKLNKALEYLEQKINDFEDYLKIKIKNNYFRGLEANGKKLLKDKSSWKIDQLYEQLELKERQILANKASILRLENELTKQKIRNSTLEEQENKSFEFYAIWEKRREEIEKGLVEQIENYKNLMLEKLNLNRELEASREQASFFEKKSSELTKDLELAQSLLDTSHKEYRNLKKNNVISKFKLASVLIADASRNFLPKSVGNFITYAETGILASEINSTSSKFTWFFIATFFVYSFVLGVLKVTSLISNSFKLLVGRKNREKFFHN